MNVISDVNDLFDEGRYEDCIKLLRNHFPSSSSKGGELQLMQARLNRSKREHLLGVAESKEIKDDTIKVSHLLQEVIQNLIPEDFLTVSSEKNESSGRLTIDDDILVVSLDRVDAEIMSKYFQSLGFINVICKTFGEDVYDAEKFKLVVFDAMRIKNPDNPNLTREQPFINEISKHLAKGFLVVFYGKTFSALDEFRDNSHAANSKFSLYARVKEMLDFLNRYHL